MADIDIGALADDLDGSSLMSALNGGERSDPVVRVEYAAEGSIAPMVIGVCAALAPAHRAASGRAAPAINDLNFMALSPDDRAVPRRALAGNLAEAPRPVMPACGPDAATP